MHISMIFNFKLMLELQKICKIIEFPYIPQSAFPKVNSNFTSFSFNTIIAYVHDLLEDPILHLIVFFLLSFLQLIIVP